jgi:GNAT superfamily N-acetyltransferase
MPPPDDGVGLTFMFVAEVDGAVVGYGRAVFAQAPAGDGPFAPTGWCVLGVVVHHPTWRRRGVGQALTAERIRWVAERANQVSYFTHRDNRASRDLHQPFGFVEMPGEWVPPGGTPVDATNQRLFVADLSRR